MHASVMFVGVPRCACMCIGVDVDACRHACVAFVSVRVIVEHRILNAYGAKSNGGVHGMANA